MTTTIAYYRVSTQRQGRSGLGLEAQRAAVVAFLGGVPGAEYVEIESGAKDAKQRPQLAAALALCRKSGATLVVAKLDRLARDAKLILTLVDGGVRVRFVDLPDLDASGPTGRLMLTVMAAAAEYERRIISQRTKAALGAAKARGTILGATGPANLRRDIEARQAAADAFAGRLRPVLSGMDAERLTAQQQAQRLNELGIRAPRGGDWTRQQVARVRDRLGLQASACVATDKQRIVAIAQSLRDRGYSLRGISDELAARGAFNAAGKQFNPKSVRSMLLAA